ncbi:hypothetical protein BGX34_011229 [Mortierella sp. NVP85]|nr:hypothetical protein BGX34_011229 [Mortierella sp. NVP85]
MRKDYEHMQFIMDGDVLGDSVSVGSAESHSKMPHRKSRRGRASTLHGPLMVHHDQEIEEYTHTHIHTHSKELETLYLKKHSEQKKNMEDSEERIKALLNSVLERVGQQNDLFEIFRENSQKHMDIFKDGVKSQLGDQQKEISEHLKLIRDQQEKQQMEANVKSENNPFDNISADKYLEKLDNIHDQLDEQYREITTSHTTLLDSLQPAQLHSVLHEIQDDTQHVRNLLDHMKKAHSKAGCYPRSYAPGQAGYHHLESRSGEYEPSESSCQRPTEDQGKDDQVDDPDSNDPEDTTDPKMSEEHPPDDNPETRGHLACASGSGEAGHHHLETRSGEYLPPKTSQRQVEDWGKNDQPVDTSDNSDPEKTTDPNTSQKHPADENPKPSSSDDGTVEEQQHDAQHDGRALMKEDTTIGKKSKNDQYASGYSQGYARGERRDGWYDVPKDDQNDSQSSDIAHQDKPEERQPVESPGGNRVTETHLDDDDKTTKERTKDRHAELPKDNLQGNADIKTAMERDPIQKQPDDTKSDVVTEKDHVATETIPRGITPGDMKVEELTVKKPIEQVPEGTKLVPQNTKLVNITKPDPTEWVPRDSRLEITEEEPTLKPGDTTVETGPEQNPPEDVELTAKTMEKQKEVAGDDPSTMESSKEPVHPESSKRRARKDRPRDVTTQGSFIRRVTKDVSSPDFFQTFKMILGKTSSASENSNSENSEQ